MYDVRSARVQVSAKAIIPSNQSNAFAKFGDHKFLPCKTHRGPSLSSITNIAFGSSSEIGFLTPSPKPLGCYR